MKSRALFLSALLFLALTTVFSGCKKDKDLPPPVLERSYMHIHNVSEAVDSFDITFDYWNVDDVVISNFYWNRNWPLSGYANLLEGGQPDQFGNGKLWVTATRQPFIGGPIDSLNGPLDIVLDPGKHQTFCIGDSGGGMFFAIFNDEFTTSPGTNALRFINMCAGAKIASLRSTDGVISIGATNFATASSFVNVPSGVYTFEAVNDLGVVVATLPSYTLYDGGTANLTLSRVSPILTTWTY